MIWENTIKSLIDYPLLNAIRRGTLYKVEKKMKHWAGKEEAGIQTKHGQILADLVDDVTSLGRYERG